MTKHIHHARHLDLLFDDTQRDGVVDEIVCGRMEFFDSFLQPAYDQWVTPGSVVVEVGAHVGTHTCYLSKLAGPTGRVLAFEPQLALFKHLCANLWLNDCHNVTPVHAALYSRACSMRPNVHPEQYWMTPGKASLSFVPTVNPADFLAVEGRTLDSYSLPRVDFVKIDAEGNDYQVMLGAVETFKRCCPVIAYEDGDDRVGRWTELLQPLGYEITRLERSNYLCVPTERAKAAREAAAALAAASAPVPVPVIGT